MKKLIFITFLLVSIYNFSDAAPSINLWKCHWVGEPSVTVTYPGSSSCKFTQDMTCTHPLWGTKTTTYEWTRPCNTGISHPTDEEMNDPNKLLRYISQAMNELVELGFNVPIEYRTISNLLNPVNLNNATIFRLALAGYSVTVEGLESDCFVPVISLPVLVPLYNEPEVNFNCVSVSPNPSSLNLTVNLGNNNIFIDKIELIENSTGTIVYQKNSSFLINENIAVSSLNKGQYTLKITNGEIINSRQIVIE